MPLLLLAALALANDPAPAGESRTFTWDLTVAGRPAGQRTATVELVEGSSGSRRVIRAMTELEGSVAGVSHSFRQRLTAHAGEGPASFHAAVEVDGAPQEIQGRRDAIGWIVTNITPRRARTDELSAADIDLSTADLLDPDSRVPLWTFDTVRMLRTEDGQIWTTPVERLGASEIVIAGETVDVLGFRLDPPVGRMDLYYDAGGVLVKTEWKWLGLTVEGVLREPPPRAQDAFPVLGDAVQVIEEEL